MSDTDYQSNDSKHTRVKKTNNEKEQALFNVVINHEEQYSIWPSGKKNALGWNNEGKIGTREECLQYIKETWTDMRPLSLRTGLKKDTDNS